MSRGTLVPPGPVFLAPRNRTLAEYAPVFLKWLSFVRQRRENTVRGYGEDLKTFFLFAEQAGLSKPDDVNFRHLEFFLGWLQKERGLKATSANRHIHALRTFWFWMVREEITAKNPAAQVFLLRTQKRLPELPEHRRAGEDARHPRHARGSGRPAGLCACGHGAAHRPPVLRAGESGSPTSTSTPAWCGW
jgi:hypothetical protein